MNKYYVKSGELERIIMAKNPLEAAQKALDNVNGEILDHYFYIDERGFRGPDEYNSLNSELLPEDALITKEIFKTLGWDDDTIFFDDGSLQ